MQSHWMRALWQMQVSAAQKGRHRSKYEKETGACQQTAEQNLFFKNIFNCSLFLKKICGVPSTLDIKCSILKTKRLMEMVSSFLNLCILSYHSPKTWLFIFCVSPMHQSSYFPSLMTFLDLLWTILAIGNKSWQTFMISVKKNNFIEV